MDETDTPMKLTRTRLVTSGSGELFPRVNPGVEVVYQHDNKDTRRIYYGHKYMEGNVN
jgi:hypothetical protein